jgi:transcriptional regulator with XRE-family HTH domain
MATKFRIGKAPSNGSRPTGFPVNPVGLWDISTRLRQARERAGYTLEEVALITDWSVDHVRRWEAESQLSWDRPKLEPSFIAILAALYGTTADVLLLGKKTLAEISRVAAARRAIILKRRKKRAA